MTWVGGCCSSIGISSLFGRMDQKFWKSIVLLLRWFFDLTGVVAAAVASVGEGVELTHLLTGSPLNSARLDICIYSGMIEMWFLLIFGRELFTVQHFRWLLFFLAQEHSSHSLITLSLNHDISQPHLLNAVGSEFVFFFYHTMR